MNIRQRGFSILELMTCIMVIAVLAAVAVPTFSEIQLNSRQYASISDLHGSLVLARSEAVKRRQVITVCASADGATCFAEGDWSLGSIVTTEDGEVIRSLPPVPASFASSQIAFRFFPSGNVGMEGQVVYCDGRGGSAARAVFVRRPGRIFTNKAQEDGSPLGCGV